MVDVALIPPYALLRDIQNRKLQMYLPTCLKAQKGRYRELAWHWNDTHIILDNGLFEDGKAIATDELGQLAAEIAADEIVLPDVRADSIATYNATTYALNAYSDLQGTDVSFMVVIQGESHKARCNLIRRFAEDLPANVGMLGFPRRLTQEVTQDRLRLMEFAAESYGQRFKLHMLGLSREWPGEFLRAVRQFGSHLRGLDSSAPYTYAYYGKPLQPFYDTEGERPSHYFVQGSDKFSRELVNYNIYVLDSWAASISPVPYNIWKEEPVICPPCKQGTHSLCVNPLAVRRDGSSTRHGTRCDCQHAEVEDGNPTSNSGANRTLQPNASTIYL